MQAQVKSAKRNEKGKWIPAPHRKQLVRARNSDSYSIFISEIAEQDKKKMKEDLLRKKEIRDLQRQYRYEMALGYHDKDIHGICPECQLPFRKVCTCVLVKRLRELGAELPEM